MELKAKARRFIILAGNTSNANWYGTRDRFVFHDENEARDAYYSILAWMRNCGSLSDTARRWETTLEEDWADSYACLFECEYIATASQMMYEMGEQYVFGRRDANPVDVIAGVSTMGGYEVEGIPQFWDYDFEAENMKARIETGGWYEANNNFRYRAIYALAPEKAHYRQLDDIDYKAVEVACEA